MRNYRIASKKVIWQMVIPKICVSIVAEEKCGKARHHESALMRSISRFDARLTFMAVRPLKNCMLYQALLLVIWCDHYSSLYNMVLLLTAILAAEYPPECFTTECTSASTNTIDGGEPSK